MLACRSIGPAAPVRMDRNGRGRGVAATVWRNFLRETEWDMNGSVPPVCDLATRRTNGTELAGRKSLERAAISRYIRVCPSTRSRVRCAELRRRPRHPRRFSPPMAHIVSVRSAATAGITSAPSLRTWPRAGPLTPASKTDRQATHYDQPSRRAILERAGAHPQLTGELEPLPLDDASGFDDHEPHAIGIIHYDCPGGDVGFGETPEDRDLRSSQWDLTACPTLAHRGCRKDHSCRIVNVSAHSRAPR